MRTTRSASRSKSLDVAPLGGQLLWFRLALDDRYHAPGGDEVIHSLGIDGVLTLPDLVIRAIRPLSHQQPYVECGDSLEPVRRLAGTRLGPGFRQRVIEVMGGTRGCTHFLSLMMDLGAAHTLSVFLRMREKQPFEARHEETDFWMKTGLQIEPRLVDACIALRDDGAVLARARREDAA